MSIRLLARVAVLVTALVCQPQPASGQAGALPAMSGLAWLAGSWAGADGGVQHEEHWTAPRGGSMVGVHRTIRDGRMAGFEFLRIEERDGVLVYLAMPNGRSPATAFPLKSLAGERVVFENTAHDFPQRVIYWKDGASLHARIEGARPDGTPGSVEWTWAPSALTP